MFELAVQAKVSVHKREEFLQTIRSLQKEEEGEMGVTDLRLFESGEDRSTYRLIKKWETEEELGKYLNGEKFRILLGALQVLSQESVVQYGSIPEKLIRHLRPMLDQAMSGSTVLPAHRLCSQEYLCFSPLRQNVKNVPQR